MRVNAQSARALRSRTTCPLRNPCCRTANCIKTTESPTTATTVSPYRRIKEVRGAVVTELNGPASETYDWSAGPPPPPSEPAVPSFKDRVATLFLPRGYPITVSADYLDYQLWNLPIHVTGVLSHSLVTTTLLKAVGVSAGPVGAVAAAAGIKWIIKDGIGAMGRSIVGSSLGPEFDDDPRRWRMIAELVSTCGLALEVATSAKPELFLLLASTGNFAQAIGKGIGKPVHRVIQNHFAAGNNVGAVAAKDEVWEVVAQLTGYAASISVLQNLQGAGSWEEIVGIWAAVQATHIALRYRGLKTLVFSSLSHKRSTMLARASVRGQALPGVTALNAAEPLFASADSLGPVVHLGVSLQDGFGGVLPSAEVLASFLELYREEGHVLIWRDSAAHVVLKEGAGATALLRVIWQAAWLQHHHEAGSTDGSSSGRGGSSSSDSGGASADEALVASISQLQASFPSFVAKVAALGWKVEGLNMKTGEVRLSVEGESRA
ncbi:MAG: hypothetical protein WDW36_005786 [Sanguina aurantia]